jgi:DNA-directed RNA polymerase sigma subunit (sigma70/sigma32)
MVDWRDEKTRELIRRWQAGDRDAGGDLCELHRGLLRQMAARLMDKMRAWAGDTLMDDLIQSARIGMLHGAKRADPDAPNTMIGYLGTWAFQAMYRDAQRYWGIILPHYKIGSAMRGRDDAEIPRVSHVSHEILARLTHNRGPEPWRHVDDADYVDSLLARTTPHRAEAIRATYGIGQKPATAREVAVTRGVTKSAVNNLVQCGVGDIRASIGLAVRGTA